MQRIQLTVAAASASGWDAVSAQGYRVHIPSSATTLRLRSGQCVWAEMNEGQIHRVWIGVPDPQFEEEEA